MMLDELELVGRLADVEPLSADALDRARAALQSAVELETTPGLAPRSGRRRRRGALVHGAFGAGIAGVAAAVTVIATSAQPAATGGQPKAGSGVAPRVTNLSLVRLADQLKASAPAVPGNATLVIRRTSYPDGTGMTGADLYTDGGAYYYSPSESGLPAAIAAGDDQGDGMFGREVAAALAAANGDVGAARLQMAYAPLGHAPAASQQPDPVSAAQATAKKKLGKAQPSPVPAGSVRLDSANIDNYIWENSMDALSAAGGNLQVRIGVLRILATLPEVAVTKDSSGGQPTLTLTATAPAMPAGYQEALTVNAGTGIPVSFAGGAPGRAPSVTISYTVSRVLLADIAAGRF